jgi:hypothetical protein
LGENLVGNRVTKWVQVSSEAAELITWNYGAHFGITEFKQRDRQQESYLSAGPMTTLRTTGDNELYAGIKRNYLQFL